MKKKETVVKINKAKSWFFEKIHKIDKTFPDSSRKKEKNQIKKIRNEKGEVTTDSAEIQRIIRDNYEKLKNCWLLVRKQQLELDMEQQTGSK